MVAGENFSFGSAASEERMEWIAPPTLVMLAAPLFLVSLIAVSSFGSSSSSVLGATTGSVSGSCLVEVHDVVSLQALQKIALPTSSVLICPLQLMGDAEEGSEMQQHLLISSGDQLYNTRMIPVATQV